MKTRVYGIHKAKKCIWYHVSNIMFQYVKKHNGMFGMCVYFFFFLKKLTSGPPGCHPRLDPPLPASPRAGFPRPAKVVGWKWDEILDPHPEVRRGWVYTF